MVAKKATFISGCLLGLMILGCNLEIGPKFDVFLDELNADSPQEAWQQFFEERGAEKIWTSLQAQSNKIPEKQGVVSLFLNDLQPPHYANQADEVTSAMLEYLACHEVLVKDLSLQAGSNPGFLKNNHPRVRENSDPNKQVYILSPSITKLVNLDSLSMNWHQLRYLPQHFSRLTDIVCLDLRENCLRVLPQNIESCSQLRNILLKDNQISALPATIGKLTLLRELELNKNQIEVFSPEIKHLKKLKELHFAENRIRSIPSEIGELASLRVLDLSHNQIEEIPEAMMQLVKLQELNLNHNKIKNIPDSISHLANLWSLSLSNNRLETIPASIWDVNLESLELSNNFLKHIPPLKKPINNLQRLYLDNNEIACIPASFIPYMVDIATQSKLGGLQLSFGFNYWLTPKSLHPYRINFTQLKAEARVTFPRDLLSLCVKHVVKKLEESSKQEDENQYQQNLHAVSNLPSSINFHQIDQKAALVQGKKLVFFELIGEQPIPFYWDQGLYNLNDIGCLFDTHLEWKQLYLVDL